MTCRSCGICCTALVMLALADQAAANGDEFFRDNAFSDDKPLEEQVIFSGRVRDEAGGYIEDATITLAITVQTPRGERRISYNAYTNNIGRFRALDVATVVLVMEEIEVDVDPKAVEITVEKEGYRLSRRLSRSKARQTRGVFEIDFWMTRAE